MNKQAITVFFDRLAPEWDANMIRSDEIIGIILDNAHVSAGTDVLDVACGTGVLFPDYMKRDVLSLTGIDLSPKMAEIASDKFVKQNMDEHEAGKTPISVICGDAEEYDFGKKFDRIVIYNAFPHFVNPEGIISKLSKNLNPGGYLTVAHGASREAIDRHHNGVPTEVSANLPEASDLAELFSKYLEVTSCISNEKMYQVVGRKK